MTTWAKGDRAVRIAYPSDPGTVLEVLPDRTLVWESDRSADPAVLLDAGTPAARPFRRPLRPLPAEDFAPC